MGKTVSKLSHDDIQHLKKETYFDKKELQQWYKGFLKDCPNGILTKDEFLKIYKQFFPFGEPKDFSNYVFKLFDKDNSNTIDFHEFILALSITSRGSLEEKLNWSFQLYDLNKDGKIDYNEMLLIVSAIYKTIGNMVKLPDDESTPEKRVEKIFKLMDKDSNGELSFDEFREGSKVEPIIISAMNLYDGLV